MSAIARSSRLSVRHFTRAQDGSLAVFAVFVFFAMLLVGGLAVDIMRHETVRLRMQDTTDRALLAATAIRENATDASPQQIVEAYFAADGLGAQLDSRVFVEDDSVIGRSVRVVAGATVPSLFMGLLGIGDFSMVTTASAVEDFAGGMRAEVVMVLDISGSMGIDNKMAAMRDAAATLAQALLVDANDGSAALTIVPYDNTVLQPPGFLNEFTNVSGSGACNDWSNWDTVTGSLSLATLRITCPTDLWAQVLPYENNPNDATRAIALLQPRGNTAIDLGVRHGALFFDPTIAPALNALIANGLVDPVFADRPLAWDAENVTRALILLTDGQNCCGERYSQIEQDANTLRICSELKHRDVLIFAVAFQAPPEGASLMQGCASSEGHFFNADVSQLTAVFQGITTNIQSQALRLTQ